MELATIKTNGLATPQTFQSPYTLALSGEKILDMKKGEATKQLIDIISTTYFEAGQITPGFDRNEQAKHLQLLAVGFYDDVKSTFRFLRMEEARLAFKKGVRKEYGEYFGINIATFSIWIKGYLQDEKRKEALAKLKDSNDTPPAPIMSKTEAEYVWKETIKKQFAHFKETGSLNIEFPSYAFEWFEANGFIKLSKEEKISIYEEAKVKVCEHKRIIRLNPKNRIELSQASAFLKRAEENKLDKDDERQIKSEARYLALKKYFESVSELKI